MNEWSDDEIDAVDIVILPSDNADLLTDDGETQDDHVKTDKASTFGTNKRGVKIYQTY